MTESLHAEWTKLRTLASTFWLLLAAAALTTAVGAAAAAATRCPAGACADDPARISLTGIYLGQAVIAVLAVTAVSGNVTMTGGLFPNEMIGGTGATTMRGGFSSDTFVGGVGPNSSTYMQGGLGPDTFIGGSGPETMVGGLSRNLFEFLPTAAGGKTVITNFVSGHDQLYLEGNSLSYLVSQGDVVTTGHNTTITLDGGKTTIELQGVTNLKISDVTTHKP